MGNPRGGSVIVLTVILWSTMIGITVVVSKDIISLSCWTMNLLLCPIMSNHHSWVSHYTTQYHTIPH